MNKPATTYSRAFAQFGVSRQEAVAYQHLIRSGATTIKTLSQKISTTPNALYRVVKSLIQKGLISATKTHPAIYKAIPPTIALDGLVHKRSMQLEEAKNELTSHLTTPPHSDESRIDVLPSMHEFFLAYADVARTAKKTIDIISIGEDVPEEIVLANRDALERGVAIRFIAHKYDKTNSAILSRWKRMGIRVAHYPDWGFHIVIVDNSISLMAVNNPKATQERLAMKIFNKGLSGAYSDYFENIWKKAKRL